MDMLKLLERALESTSRLVATVTPDQFSNRTPCSDYDLRALLNHVCGSNWMFALAHQGKEIPATAPPDLVGEDHVAAYEQSRKATLDEWAKPGAFERVLKLPFGEFPGAVAIAIHFTEQLVHGWDIAKAAGQDPTLDPELGEICLNMNKMAVNEDLRGAGKPFGPEVTVPDDAPVTNRLVAFLGRQP